MSKKKKREEFFGDEVFEYLNKELDELKKELIADINMIQVFVRKKK